MVYSPVTGTIADFGWGVLPGVEVVFTPSGNAIINDGVSPAVFATRPVVAVPDSQGVFNVNLQATDAVFPAVWFTIRLRWLDSAGGYIYSDFLPWKLHVPTGGGQIADLLETPWTPYLAWHEADEPPGTPSANTLWLNPDTGELKIWSN